MNEDLRKKLELLRFEPTELGTMVGRVEDVEFSAVVHPLKGLVLITSHVGSREAAFLETVLPEDCSLQQIAKALSHAFEKIHPERKCDSQT